MFRSPISPEYRRASKHRIGMGKYRVMAAMLALGLAAAAIPAFGKPLDEGCVKFEGSDLGVEGVGRATGEYSVVLSDWVEKPGDRGEFIGFSFAAAGGVVETVAVKAGRGTDLSSPGSASGSFIDGADKAKAVSNVVICFAPERVID